MELKADGRDLAVLPVLLPGAWSAAAARQAVGVLAEDDDRGEQKADAF